MEKAKLYRQGGSTVVIIPKNYLKSLGWQRGEVVHVMLEGPGRISYFKLGDDYTIFKLTQLKTSIKKEKSDEADRIHPS